MLYKRSPAPAYVATNNFLPTPIKEHTMEKHTIEVKEKNVYGRVLYFPVNDLAKIMVGVMKAKTFSQNQLLALEKMGDTLTETYIEIIIT